MLGDIGVSIGSDKSAYYVGDTPMFSIIGAKPRSQVLWSSFLNGQEFEYDVDRGDTIGPNGTAQLYGAPFTSDDVGTWQKQITINAPDGTSSIAQVMFSVSPIPVAVGAPVPTSFFDQSLNKGGAQIPVWLLLGGALAILFLKKH